MNSISKRRRDHFEKVIVEGSEDRISNLPRNLICHVLSFLPTKNAVATSILSTKWKHLWTSITTLDFDDELVIVTTNSQQNNKENQSVLKTSFINFVYRVLTRNISELQKFHLRCIRSYDVSHLNVWVSAALSRNLRELHLSHLRELCPHDWSLPRELFTCPSLVVLKLSGTSRGTFILDVPTLVCLQSLKILVIDSLMFLDDDSIDRLFTGCPVLEDLSITKCDSSDISVFNISAPFLKSLTIKGLTVYDLHYCDCKYKIVLNTPKLQDLIYEDYLAEGYSGKLNALVKASIRVELLGYDVTKGSEFAVGEFVKSISKVQWLYLSGGSMKTFELCRLWLRKFDRLTYLEFGNDEYIGWEWLLYFVENSPQLETLIFEGLPQDDQEENQTISRWIPPQQVPSCLLFHLKKIEFKKFEGENDELKMVEYFLENSRVLEKLVIGAFDRELEICKKVLMLPRGSKTCRVEVL